MIVGVVTSHRGSNEDHIDSSLEARFRMELNVPGGHRFVCASSARDAFILLGFALLSSQSEIGSSLFKDARLL